MRIYLVLMYAVLTALGFIVISCTHVPLTDAEKQAQNKAPRLNRKLDK